MKIKTIFIPVENSAISRDRAAITKVIAAHSRMAAKLLRVKRKILTFTIHPYWWGGYSSAESKEWIRVKMPRNWRSPRERALYLRTYLPASVYHEMCHIAQKWVYSPERKYPKFTLLEAIVLEGLAATFEEERVPPHKAQYARYRKSLIHVWLPAVRKEKNSTIYDYNAWFHGRGKPNGLGYKIGKYVIDELKKRRPDVTVDKLIGFSTHKIVKWSGVKL